MPRLIKQEGLEPTQLVSISQAAKLTPYSTEYLSLLARKGRIKAVKIARDWLTTEAAVKQYLQEQERKHKRFLRQLQIAESHLS